MATDTPVRREPTILLALLPAAALVLATAPTLADAPSIARTSAAPSVAALVPAALRDGGEVVVSVADEGPGIAPGDREGIFDSFTRLGGHLTGSTQGSGLGLFVARGLAERCGARIEVDSTLGEGSVFRLVLPAPRGSLRSAPVRRVLDVDRTPLSDPARTHRGHVAGHGDAARISAAARSPERTAPSM